MEKYTTFSAKETSALGEAFAKRCRKGETVAFFGGLGMGKTSFIKGLAKGLGVTSDITSPTFSLINEYKGKNFNLYHFDMYRISSWDDLYSIGFFDYVDSDGLLAVEWSENIENALPEDSIYIVIRASEKGENVREIKIGKREEFYEDTCS
jgi:tRNA threonylcarbamoyladenosine biosynthesis protein TsaE